MTETAAFLFSGSVSPVLHCVPTTRFSSRGLHSSLQAVFVSVHCIRLQIKDALSEEVERFSTTYLRRCYYSLEILQLGGRAERLGAKGEQKGSEGTGRGRQARWGGDTLELEGEERAAFTKRRFRERKSRK